MDMKLELVPVPVTDIDRAKAFYADQVGFVLDLDAQPVEGMRIVQLTPPGSACSILLSTGLPQLADMAAGSIKGLHLQRTQSSRLGDLRREPRRVGKPLRAELTGTWSARRGPYRIVYSIDDGNKTVAVLRIDHRADVYRHR